jgi:hypothetical protein
MREANMIRVRDIEYVEIYIKNKIEPLEINRQGLPFDLIIIIPDQMEEATDNIQLPGESNNQK